MLRAQSLRAQLARARSKEQALILSARDAKVAHARQVARLHAAHAAEREAADVALRNGVADSGAQRASPARPRTKGATNSDEVIALEAKLLNEQARGRRARSMLCVAHSLASRRRSIRFEPAASKS